MPSNGVTISVTAETNAGGRKHMEDYIAVNLAPNDTLKEIPDMREQAYIGVFDGHGGKEAAKYAREELWSYIQNQNKFLSHDLGSVKEAITEAYLELHQKMLEQRPFWQPNKTGDLSTAGTTASIVIFRKNHMFVANVGDSTAIMGIINPHYGQPGEPQLVAQVITRDHKPDDPAEQKLIRESGGDVAISPKGVIRVVWERSRSKPNGSTEINRIPFLSVARSLGDFWSYNPLTEKYAVSPNPDVSVIPLNISVQKFVVIASDGLWNVMSPNDVVSFIHNYQSQDTCHQPKDVVSALIREALHRWCSKGLQADNIAILIAFLSEEDKDTKSNNSSIQKSSSPLKTVASPSSSSSPSSHSAHSNDVDSHDSTRPVHSPTPIIEPLSSSNGGDSLLVIKLPEHEPNVDNERTTNERTTNERTTVLTEMEMKMRKRKHKKHRKHGLERELARRGLHKFRKSVSCTHHSVVLKPIVETSILPSLDQEFSMFESINGVKRSHPDEDIDNNEEDEGILIPASQKRLKEDDDSSMESLVPLRSERLTDTASDSGSSSSSSSGVSSDSTIEEGLPEPATGNLIMEIEIEDTLTVLNENQLCPI